MGLCALRAHLETHLHTESLLRRELDTVLSERILCARQDFASALEWEGNIREKEANELRHLLHPNQTTAKAEGTSSDIDGFSSVAKQKWESLAGDIEELCRKMSEELVEQH